MTAAYNPYMQFHHVHGTNIQLDPSHTQATRVESFANGICFSKDPLEPGQLFLIEIDEKERGWCGHMRIGLTAQNPSSLAVVPEYSLPDLVNLGHGWVFAVTRNHNRVICENDGTVPSLKPCNIFEKPYLQIEKIRIPREKLVGRSRPGFYSHLLDDLYKSNILPPTARRSRIGVLYTIQSDGTREMHIIINGEDMGASAKGIPPQYPLYVVVDVFASTKSVRIVQIEYGFPSLQTLCRKVVQKHIIHRLAIDWLDLPELLKNFCKYE
ncbi:neuralized-like protein 2 [Protopterus annectens]|uniref:neuralized-like protein 2 n=1 Tax=Protopterus annectens TaxID=7888 RepID=UPI001CFA415A|nr:neuralized-like protein 2 [Protopterus annectens]